MLPVSVLAKGPAKKLIIFGDSLSDSGNFFAETGECARAPFEPIPSAPYAIGGHHFSNGRTWVEQLATRMRVPHNGRPASLAPGVFTNYAFGRSRARSGAPVFSLFDLSTQVNLFYTDFGGSGPSDATYVMWIGSNDVRDSLAAMLVDPSGAQSGAIIEEALTSIANNIIALYGAGARVFLVANSPNIAISPAVRALGLQNPMIPIVAEQLTIAFNEGLLSTLESLEGLLPDIRVVGLDAFSVLNEVIADPESVGLSNVTDSCLEFGVVGQTICSRPNQYLFWDATHPTKAGHAVLAEAAAQVLSAP
jgi:phospholipase/lecithinase/hemolysin